MPWIDVAAAADVVEDGVLAVAAGGFRLALFRLGQEVFALLDQCSHGAAQLSDGYVVEECIECPLHQGLIDIRTGEPRGAPVINAVRSFHIRIREGRVEVET
jgi:CDP-4-dehydro-6-deoxyglucose reductase